jgi:hypothetical protein
MDANCVLLALCVASETRREQAEALKRLRRRLHDEILRHEWRMMVRMRHYVTLECLQDPSRSSWMNTWERGSDENFINTTSLHRYVVDEI